ncbi:cytochrome c [Altererythrobacter sp. CC-YST694]|uniref:c-type cytochrome n=1 Tax=Altererythrobacter sp. CC-YST694 TaxID=2755038 RepID=UPI001D032418|nr:cytochrome c [Altererythrobacter sp. CC-YST694]MCB5425052.1 cytochrome c [Altererythrobacter sp. CC-YST694]
MLLVPPLAVASLAVAIFGAEGVGGQTAQAAVPGPAAAPHVVKADLPGRAIFEQNCAPCHGAGPGDDGAPMLPGTMTLERRYQGEIPGALELRDDLDGDTLRLFVRNGIGAMPMFRKSELSDADVDAVAAYLKATAEASAVK